MATVKCKNSGKAFCGIGVRFMIFCFSIIRAFLGCMYVVSRCSGDMLNRIVFFRYIAALKNGSKDVYVYMSDVISELEGHGTKR